MNGKCQIYEGKYFRFTKGKQIGKGGNGRVFEANILDATNNEVCVVKILSLGKWKDKLLKEKRYRRFYREIYDVQKFQNDISGIMKVLDFYCPYKMDEKCDVWYLMHKAETYHNFSNNNNFDINTKVEYLLNLSNILCLLHEKGYAHRDIKIENILFLENQMMLSDFGLIWNVENSRVTENNERVGPYFIGPPELESVAIDDMSLDDFRPSDVYLFAKVVWMIIKNDHFGFRGEYKRDNQFYLVPKEYGITTFEPIHRLLEKSTRTNIDERINMVECRSLLSEQLSVINNGFSDKALKYSFEESEKEIINNEEPDERVYRDFKIIYNILEKITPVSKLTIEGANEIINVKFTNKWMGESIVFKSMPIINGQVYSYLSYPDYIKHINKNEGFELHLKSVEREDIHNEFVSYKESRLSSWGTINYNIFLDEPLVIRFEKINYM